MSLVSNLKLRKISAEGAGTGYLILPKEEMERNFAAFDKQKYPVPFYIVLPHHKKNRHNQLIKI